MSEPRPETDETEPVSRPEQTASIELDGPWGRYTVTASTLNLRGKDGKERASVFSVAYVLDSPRPRARPVTFCFNGGPGSSAVWLQFGALGPKRVDIPDVASAPPPPNELVDNLEGILDLTDLVFVDPVGTGFSRGAGKTEDKEFHAVKEDVESIGEFIQRWCSRNERWSSPKFLAGESYGTTRSGGLALYLQDKGIALSGVVLISLATNFQTFVAETGNDLPHLLYLPSFAALAAYHGVVSPPGSLRDWLDEARSYAFEVYAPALLQGSALPARRRAEVAARLSAFTGLPASEIDRRQLRIPYLWFARTLLGRGSQTIGRLDGRYVGPDLDPYSQSMQRDPSYDAPLPAYTAAVNDFLRREVGYESEELYEVLSMDVNRGWRWGTEGRLGFVNTTEDLRKAMVSNPHLKVYVGSGLYDLATPFFAAEYTVAHLGVDAELAENITVCDYPAGHMMYFHEPSRKQLRADLAAFYEAALS
jgi:carboxypeptidase C (cathepsin A)